ncbi:hypothetical protein DFH09DRAFT_1361826 [Mycena vulgaris]|nr:hypothetical protein DFH09DRAFT_1374760 [Mycena vulgaris]KAJ6575686.1 hypothetical protein DFH09DRAFT_1361826 [Mycena vulgaris]
MFIRPAHTRDLPAAAARLRLRLRASPPLSRSTPSPRCRLALPISAKAIQVQEKSAAKTTQTPKPASSWLPLCLPWVTLPPPPASSASASPLPHAGPVRRPDPALASRPRVEHPTSVSMAQMIMHRHVSILSQFCFLPPAPFVFLSPHPLPPPLAPYCTPLYLPLLRLMHHVSALRRPSPLLHVVSPCACVPPLFRYRYHCSRLALRPLTPSSFLVLSLWRCCRAHRALIKPHDISHTSSLLPLPLVSLVPRPPFFRPFRNAPRGRLPRLYRPLPSFLSAAAHPDGHGITVRIPFCIRITRPSHPHPPLSFPVLPLPSQRHSFLADIVSQIYRRPSPPSRTSV